VRSAKCALAAVVIDIPDFTAPSPDVLATGLAEVLFAMEAAPDEAVYVGCRAGIGRTGMVIAGLARIAEIRDPIGWTRVHYHPHAVETAGQEQAVLHLDPRAVWAHYRRLTSPAA
jgi:protein-tyrosine phosphatase